MVTDRKGIPLSVRALDDNSSDKKVFIKTIKEVTQNLNIDQRVYHIADSAFYTEDNVKEIGNNAFFVSRVPATINETKELLTTDLVLETCSDERYSCYAVKSCYGGVEQLWIVFCSEEMKKKKKRRNTEKEIKFYKVVIAKFKDLISKWKDFRSVRSIIEDVFKLVKKAYFMEDLHKYTRSSVQKYCSLAVLLVGMTVNYKINERKELKAFFE